MAVAPGGASRIQAASISIDFTLGWLQANSVKVHAIQKLKRLRIRIVFSLVIGSYYYIIAGKLEAKTA